MNETHPRLLSVDQENGLPVVSLLTTELRSDSVIARLEKELDEYLEESGVKQLVLDLSAVHFLTSSGLRVLIMLRRRLRERGGRFTMCGVHPYVEDVFKTTRLFTDKFDVFPDVEAAAKALRSPEGKSS